MQLELSVGKAQSTGILNIQCSLLAGHHEIQLQILLTFTSLHFTSKLVLQLSRSG